MTTPRDYLENAMTKRVSAALAAQFRALQDLIALGTPPTEAWWEEQERLLSEALLPELGRIAIAGHAAVGMPAQKASPVVDAIRDWLLGYGTELIRGLTATSREALTGALGDFFGGGVTLQELMDGIAPYFGVDRAMRIAVTEATRAYDLGDQVATQELKDAGFQVKDIWNTNRDSLVDHDCEVRDGRPSDEWPDQRRPPLHVNCRCWVTHSVFG